MLPHVTATAYITPLREGGSLPGLMEADDLGIYVVKFRGAGQGPKALVAEVIAGRIAGALGLPVPDLVTVDVDAAIAAGEPDPEVQALLRASAGVNLGVDYLPGALDFDPATPGPDTGPAVDAAFAARVLWFDALLGNVDRSWRNPNMLLWHRRPYLIDHGATLTFQHSWASAAGFATRAYDAADHVFAVCGADVEAADAELAPAVTDEVLRAAADAVPAVWLEPQPPPLDGVAALRAAYAERIGARLAARAAWLPQLRAAVEAATAAGAAARRTAPGQRGHGRPGWLTSRTGGGAGGPR